MEQKLNVMKNNFYPKKTPKMGFLRKTQMKFVSMNWNFGNTFKFEASILLFKGSPPSSSVRFCPPVAIFHWRTYLTPMAASETQILEEKKVMGFKFSLKPSKPISKNPEKWRKERERQRGERENSGFFGAILIDRRWLLLVFHWNSMKVWGSWNWALPEV